MSVLEQVQQQIAEMVARGCEPGGIVMSPPEMKRFMADANATDYLRQGSAGSGWEVFGLPIYRSWEISGPAVVSRDVLRALRKMGRPFVGVTSMHHALTDEATTASLDPLLF